MKKILFTLSLMVLAAACGHEQNHINARTAPAPVYQEKADGSGDSADGSCLIVLRSVGRVSNNQGGYMTSCDLGISSGSCNYVWEGFVDVDASRLPAGVEVLYRISATGATWYAVAASEIGAGESGYRRYRFVISEGTPDPGMSTSSLNRTVIELIPYAVTSAGGRIFDHNRIADPFGNYRLEQNNLWSISADESCLPRLEIPEYRFFYQPWEQKLAGGQVTAGGKVKIVYDGRRLRSSGLCLGGSGPSSGTRLYVGFKFDSNSAIGQAEVESYSEKYGYLCPTGGTCVEVSASQPVIDIPSDARRVEFWFYCVPWRSGSAAAYDSNYGQNYALELAQPEPENLWAGNYLLNISRGASDPCEGGRAYTGEYTYDSWARTRATYKNVCFDVWKPGVTDWDNPDIWKQLDVKVHYFYAGQQQESAAYVNMVYRTGNNARYALNVGAFDPFAIYNCPNVPYTTFVQNGMEFWRAEYYFYFTVNGREIRPNGAGSFFRGIYLGQNTPWHAEYCR